MKDLTRVRFTNRDKMMYPELKLSKKDVIEYYIRIAHRILPFLKDSALVRTRYPDGIRVTSRVLTGRHTRMGEVSYRCRALGGRRASVCVGCLHVGP